MEGSVSKKKQETNIYNILYCFPYLLYCTVLSGDNNIITFDPLIYVRKGERTEPVFANVYGVQESIPPA